MLDVGREQLSTYAHAYKGYKMDSSNYPKPKLPAVFIMTQSEMKKPIPEVSISFVNTEHLHTEGEVDEADSEPEIDDDRTGEEE